MSFATFSFRQPRPTSGGYTVSEGSDIPVMRPRTGRRGTDRQLLKLLDSALENISHANCTFWACEGPSRPRPMCTCNKCWSMREIATVRATLAERAKAEGRT